MINKKLIAFDRGAMRFVGANVAFQWLGMLCNIIFVRAVAQLVGAVFAGELTHEMLRQDFVLCLFTIPLRYVFTLLASSMSDCASKDVKRTLRSKIYEKLTRLGAGYSETIATSEAVMLASEGVEQIDTYFAKYLPQLFYSLLAPAGTSSRAISSMTFSYRIRTWIKTDWTKSLTSYWKRYAQRERRSASPGTTIRQSLSKASF